MDYRKHLSCAFFCYKIDPKLSKVFIEKPVFSFESNDVDALIEKKMDKNAAVSSFFYSYFGTVDKEIRYHLEKICYFTTRDKNKILFYEGQEGNNIYFLASGNIKLFRTDVEGKEVILHFIEPGELFAGLLLVLDAHYPFSAVSLKPVELLAINAGEMRKVLRLNPEFAIKVIETIAKRQKFFIDSIKNLALSNPRTRLLNYLKYLSKRNGCQIVRLPVAKREIALLLGITPETLSRLFRTLIDENAISIRDRKIELHNHNM